MATDSEKMVKLIRERTRQGVPSEPAGEAKVQDESGDTMLRFGFSLHRDIITDAGYEAAPEVVIDIAATVAAMCGKIIDLKVMEAALLTPLDLEALVSDDGSVDEENKPAVALSYMLLREALKEYSRKRNEERK